MLLGKLIGLRARVDSDVAVLHEELYEDVPMAARADTRPWRPIAPGPESPWAPPGPDDTAAVFSIVELATGELVGGSGLWGIDRHNRHASIGISLRPAYRGRGFGADCIRTSCAYGFDILGLQRLSLGTLVDNHAMIATALSCGFVREGQLRRAVWTNGRFSDDLIFGLLADEWRAATPSGETPDTAAD